MPAGINQVKKTLKYLSFDRIERALGRDEAIRLMNEIDTKAPKGVRRVDATPLLKKEEAFLDSLEKSKTPYEDIKKYFNAKGSQVALCRFGKLAYRYFINLK